MYFVSCFVDIILSSTIGVAAETIIADIDFLFAGAFELAAHFQTLLVPPVIGKDAVCEMKELIILAIQCVLVLNVAIFRKDAIIPYNGGIGDEMVYLLSQILYPLFEEGYIFDLTFNIDQITIKFAFLSNCYE